MNAVAVAVTAALAPATKNHPTRSTDKERDERYYHFRNVEMDYDNGREVRDVTAFVRKDHDDKYYVAYAECDARDGFCRRTGRTVARRKWFAKKRRVVDPAGVNYETLLHKWMVED